MEFGYDVLEHIGNEDDFPRLTNNSLSTQLVLDSKDTSYFVCHDNDGAYIAPSVVVVKKYDGTTWETVSKSEFASLKYDTGSIDRDKVPRVSINFDNNGTPYVSYLDADNGDKVSVMNYDGSSWSIVGDAGFSAGKAYGIIHVIDQDGNVYVLYSDHVNGKRMTVMKYDQSLNSTD